MAERRAHHHGEVRRQRARVLHAGLQVAGLLQRLHGAAARARERAHARRHDAAGAVVGDQLQAVGDNAQRHERVARAGHRQPEIQATGCRLRDGGRPITEPGPPVLNAPQACHTASSGLRQLCPGSAGAGPGRGRPRARLQRAGLAAGPAGDPVQRRGARRDARGVGRAQGAQLPAQAAARGHVARVLRAPQRVHTRAGERPMRCQAPARSAPPALGALGRPRRPPDGRHRPGRRALRATTSHRAAAGNRARA